MRILIDTGATTTFISEKSLRKTKHHKYINKDSYSFLLADGVAPFLVSGIVELTIKFGDQLTKIHAHVARNLCNDMIIGMDYINRYNLNINIKQQTISIDNNKHKAQMVIDKDFDTQIFPVTLSKSVHISPNSTQQTNVSIPISSIISSFVPNSRFIHNTSLFVAHTRLIFQRYSTSITLSNDSEYPRFIQKGLCIGYLMCYPPHQYCQHHPCSSKGTLLGETSFSDTSSVPRSTGQKDISTQDNHIYNTIQPPIICNTIQSIHPKVEHDIQQLVSKTEDKNRHDDLLSLLHRFHIIFDTTKHNIANTPINHVINTLPHSPPAQRPYPQPNTEESMYKICQEFLKAGLISESHSPYAAPALLVKKSDGKDRLVID
ncbi:unnamed protein product [Didymodactylos carnosus]|uniref:Uncharacterized protein n=1 Tax=Didymodactylos carnosus TaxID=1234261 RepID=A0A814U6Z0_9BILA|nr:unnamed protein product [Didymodactylos carnosus]CAF3936396.1 unnamed protein product [Didymodactylos carnosus]